MSWYRTLMVYATLTATAIIGCERPKEPDPFYITGTVKGENFYSGDNIVRGSSYQFTLETEQGIKFVECGWDAEKMDALITAGDRLRLRIRPNFSFTTQKPEDKEVSIALEDIVEINGKPVVHK